MADCILVAVAATAEPTRKDEEEEDEEEGMGEGPGKGFSSTKGLAPKKVPAPQATVWHLSSRPQAQVSKWLGGGCLPA